MPRNGKSTWRPLGESVISNCGSGSISRGKRCRFCARTNHRAPRKGRKRSHHDAPAEHEWTAHRHLSWVKAQHEQDLEDGFGSVHLTFALERKIPSASREWAWKYVFPAECRSRDPRSGIERRHHMNGKNLQNAVKTAVQKSRVPKQASCHTLRHSFATKTATIFDRAGTARSQGRQHDDDLYARAQ